MDYAKNPQATLGDTWRFWPFVTQASAYATSVYWKVGYVARTIATDALCGTKCRLFYRIDANIGFRNRLRKISSQISVAFPLPPLA
jgi:hypothetical protein